MPPIRNSLIYYCSAAPVKRPDEHNSCVASRSAATGHQQGSGLEMFCSVVTLYYTYNSAWFKLMLLIGHNYMVHYSRLVSIFWPELFDSLLCLLCNCGQVLAVALASAFDYKTPPPCGAWFGVSGNNNYYGYNDVDQVLGALAFLAFFVRLCINCV
jgi:hypothetical protein